MFCTAKTKLPASIWTDTKQQKKKTDVKQTPVSTQPPRTASKNMALPSPDSNGLASPPPPSSCHMRKVMAPPPAAAMTRIPLSPVRQQQTQPAKSSNNEADMIARLISENKSLHEKLSTLTSCTTKATISPRQRWRRRARSFRGLPTSQPRTAWSCPTRVPTLLP